MKRTSLVILIMSCSSHRPLLDQDINNYCQDLSVLHQRIRVITSNIANEKTTRTLDGGHYKRKSIKECKDGLCKIEVDSSPPIQKYEPKHPDAKANGYVSYPNINVLKEEADILTWKKVYETVLKNSPVPHNFFFKDPKAKLCFKKYPVLKEELDFSNYLGRELNK